MTTKPCNLTRKEKRAIRMRLARKAARLERRKLRENDLTQTKVAAAVATEVKRNKVITFEDLDGDQLLAYRGIHEWWDSQQAIGGIAAPLTVGGYAGTGKSTLLAICLPKLKNSDGSDVRVSYCAYTGKAANVLMMKKLAASTIHSLIYNAIPDGKGGFIFILKSKEEVDCEIIVVDEASMIPKDMQVDLESLGISILYTGDHGQLPPVQGFGNVMADPIFKLETPHRFALESGIITVATMFRKRERVKKGIYGKYGDTEVVGKAAINDIEMLSSASIVICYSNHRRASLNERIREYRGYDGIMPSVGEKLICTKNNKNTRMFNGLIVTVKSIELIDKVYLMDVEDESGKVHLSIKACTEYFKGDPHPKIFGETFFDLFEFAYAITGHKSQGSQWDHVVVIQEDMYRENLDIKRRWIYTTTTRAAKRLTLISKNN
ncbi:Dda-like helicase [Colwellia phage 9A]|uniref:Deoxyribonuclease n=1 Tax=Colwellia phage 9A TaxID=765765 RepID=I3UMF8_9CAUD|nr:Dda-like helicase [Colwellia phage 9A]AFK66673.1 deoxyribonuclease [Colwellia phage 9A]